MHVGIYIEFDHGEPTPERAMLLVDVAPAGGAKPGTLNVTRAEVAGFCLDCVDKNEWVRRAPIIWNGK